MRTFSPKYRISDSLLAMIADAETLNAYIRSSKVGVSWLEAIRLDVLIRRAHFSTAIEGNPLTLPEVKALAEGRRINAPQEAKREVLNYFAALGWIEKQENAAITEKRLLKLHQLLTQGILPKSDSGAYKKRRNVIMGAGRIIYTPPDPAEAKPLTKALLDWLEQEGKRAHPIISQAIAHYEIARIHPFIDGNGRCARCLAVWALYRRKFDTEHIFAIDQFYKEDHQGYHEALGLIRKEGGDLTSWLEYCALAAKTTLERTRKRLEELSLPKTAGRLELTRQQERLLLALKASDGLSAEEMQKNLSVKKARLYRIIKPLSDKGIIRSTKNRPVIYRIKS